MSLTHCVCLLPIGRPFEWHKCNLNCYNLSFECTNRELESSPGIKHLQPWHCVLAIERFNGENPPPAVGQPASQFITPANQTTLADPSRGPFLRVSDISPTKTEQTIGVRLPLLLSHPLGDPQPGRKVNNADWSVVTLSSRRTKPFACLLDFPFPFLSPSLTFFLHSHSHSYSFPVQQTATCGGLRITGVAFESASQPTFSIRFLQSLARPLACLLASNSSQLLSQHWEKVTKITANPIWPIERQG